MPGGLCRLTAGLSVLLQMPLVACHRPEWRVRPVCLCLKQWGLFLELEANLWQGQSMRLVHGHGIPTSLCMCILWDQAHQKCCTSVFRPPIIVCVGTTASAGLSVFVTLSIFLPESCCRHTCMAGFSNETWSSGLCGCLLTGLCPLFQKNLAQQNRGASVPQCRMYHRRTSG